MQFVEIDPKGNAINAGWAPHLDLEPMVPADMALIEDVLTAHWIAKDLEQVALAHASKHLVPEHFDEVRARREKTVRRMIRETYKWIVAPMQEARPGKGLSELRWEHFQVNPGAQNWSQEVERVLKENELLINEWAPIHLV